MKLAPFCILVVFALIYAGLTAAETAMYQGWDKAMEQQRIVQYKVSYFQRQNEMAQNLLKRIAVDSQHDPALGQLLADRKIKVVIKGGDQAKPAGAAANLVQPIPAPSNP